MKLFDLEHTAQIGLVNTGQKESLGVGFDGNNFDDKFIKKVNEEHFTDWKIQEKSIMGNNKDKLEQEEMQEWKEWAEEWIEEKEEEEDDKKEE